MVSNCDCGYSKKVLITILMMVMILFYKNKTHVYTVYSIHIRKFRMLSYFFLLLH